jgi:hypothetical protein
MINMHALAFPEFVRSGKNNNKTRSWSGKKENNEKVEALPFFGLKNAKRLKENKKVVPFPFKRSLSREDATFSLSSSGGSTMCDLCGLLDLIDV